MRTRLGILFVLFLTLPSQAQTIPEGGCVQRKLAAVVQGAKLMARCYTQAARRAGPVEHGCLERSASRMTSSLDRLERAGCPQTADAEQLTSATAAYVQDITELVTNASEAAVASAIAKSVPVEATPKAP